MKILLLTDYLKLVEKSGVGRAIYHQKEALRRNNISYTTDGKEEYDIVHINTVFPSSLLKSKRARARGKKVVYHAHSTEEDFRNSFRASNMVAPLFKIWLKKCYESADLIITPTPYAKKLLEGYGLKKPVVSISNGVDLEYFKRDNDAGMHFREKYHLEKEDKVIISVGLYIERKGILDFVELAKTMPEYQFIWFGYTNLNTVPSKIKKAVKTKLPNLFFPGYVNREELRDAYSGSDLFLFLSYEETEGIVLLEALGMKTPALIRDIPVYGEWLLDGKNIYKAGDFTEFQRKIKAILNKQLPDLTENGFEVARERNIKEIGNQLICEYQELLSC